MHSEIVGKGNQASMDFGTHRGSQKQLHGYWGNFNSISLASFTVNSYFVQFGGRASALLFLGVSESSQLSHSLSNREQSYKKGGDSCEVVNLCSGSRQSCEAALPYLANMMLEFGLLVAGPVGLHLMVYISLLWAWRSWTHTSCFILQIWKKHWQQCELKPCL